MGIQHAHVCTPLPNAHCHLACSHYCYLLLTFLFSVLPHYLCLHLSLLPSNTPSPYVLSVSPLHYLHTSCSMLVPHIVHHCLPQIYVVSCNSGLKHFVPGFAIMVQLTLVVYGFFELWNSKHIKSPWHSDPSMSTFHCVYNTALQCINNTALPVKFHIFSPVGNVTFKDWIVLFIITCAYFPPDGKPVKLEGIYQAPLQGTYNHGLIHVG